MLCILILKFDSVTNESVMLYSLLYNPQNVWKKWEMRAVPVILLDSYRKQDCETSGLKLGHNLFK